MHISYVCLLVCLFSDKLSVCSQVPNPPALPFNCWDCRCLPQHPTKCISIFKDWISLFLPAYYHLNKTAKHKNQKQQPKIFLDHTSPCFVFYLINFRIIVLCALGDKLWRQKVSLRKGVRLQDGSELPPSCCLGESHCRKPPQLQPRPFSAVKTWLVSALSICFSVHQSICLCTWKISIVIQPPTNYCHFV